MLTQLNIWLSCKNIPHTLGFMSIISTPHNPLLHHQVQAGPTKGNDGVGNRESLRPSGHYRTNYNDYRGTGPGNPGSKRPHRNHSRRLVKTGP